MREEFYAGLEDRKYLPLPEAQKKALQVRSLYVLCLASLGWQGALASSTWSQILEPCTLALLIGNCCIQTASPACWVGRLGLNLAGLWYFMQVDWADPANAPAKPALLGTKVYQDFPIEELLPYIDWNPFFQASACAYSLGFLIGDFGSGAKRACLCGCQLQSVVLICTCVCAAVLPGHLQVWQLRGRYPNRGYPKIFNDETVGSEAKKLFDEAQEMLNVGEEAGRPDGANVPARHANCLAFLTSCAGFLRDL